MPRRKNVNEEIRKRAAFLIDRPLRAEITLLQKILVYRAGIASPLPINIRLRISLSSDF